MPPMRFASAMAARAPATSVPRPAITGMRLSARSFAASAMAESISVALPRIQASAMAVVPRPARSYRGLRCLRHSHKLLVVFDVGEARVLMRRAFKRAAGLLGLPVDNVLDLLGELEVLVGDALGSVILQANFDPGVRRGDVRMVPCCFGEMADGVDHH